MSRVILVSLFLSAAFSTRAMSQCPLASFSPIDYGAQNSVHLEPVWPGEFAVPGLTQKLVASGVPGGWASVLVFSSEVLAPGEPPSWPFADELIVNPYFVIASLYDSTGNHEWSVQIPPNPALVGETVYAQSIHVFFDQVRLSNGLRDSIGGYGAEIEVVDVHVQSPLVSGQLNSPFDVVLENHGNAPALVPVTVSTGAGSFPATLGPVQPQSTFTGTVFCTAPVVPFNCGGSFNANVTAHSNLIDCDPANNSVTRSVVVASAYWNLEYSVESQLSTFHKCNAPPIGWTVKIKNVGNVPSPPVCSKTALSLSSGNPSIWTDTAGINFFTVPSLNPGQTFVYDVSNYFLNCGSTVTGTQYLKAGVDYGAGCSDLCTVGNVGAKHVTIVP